MSLTYPSHKIATATTYTQETLTACVNGSVVAMDCRTRVRIGITGAGTFTLEASTEDGMYRMLVCETIAGGSTLSLASAGNTKLLNGSWAPTVTGEALGVMWNATLSKWVELWRSQAAASGGGTYGQATAAFTLGMDSITVSVVDAGVSTGSNIIASVGVSPGRDPDEFEFTPVIPYVATITPGVGFDILVVTNGDSDGACLINYTRD